MIPTVACDIWPDSEQGSRTP